MTRLVMTIIGRALFTLPIFAAACLILRKLRNRLPPKILRPILIGLFCLTVVYVPPLRLPAVISDNPLSDLSSVTAVSLTAVIDNAADRPDTFTELLAFVWLCGFAAELILNALGHLAYLRVIKRAEVERRRFGRLTVILCHDLPTFIPSAYGIFSPIVVMPSSCGGMRRKLLRHELAHIRNGDNVLRLFVTLVCAVYWFDPFVSAVKRALYETNEIICDAYALRGVDDEARSSYSRELIRRSRRIPGQKRMRFTAAFPYNGTQNKNAMKVRLEEIMKERRPTSKKRRVIIIAAAVVLLCACLFTMSMAYSTKEVTLGEITLTIPGYWAIKKTSDTRLDFYMAGAPAGYLIRCDTDEDYAAWYQTLERVQLLAPVEGRPYSWAQTHRQNGGTYVNEGWFFNYDRTALDLDSRYIFFAYEILGRRQTAATEIALTAESAE